MSKVAAIPVPIVPVDHLDARRLVVPLWASVIVAIAMVGSAATVVGLYMNITYKLEILQGNIASLSSKISDITEATKAALTAQDLENWCLKAQIANSNWRCPVITTDGAIGIVATPRPRPALAPARPRPPDKTSTAP